MEIWNVSNRSDKGEIVTEQIDVDEIKIEVKELIRKLNKENQLKDFQHRRSCIVSDFIPDEVKQKLGLI